MTGKRLYRVNLWTFLLHIAVVMYSIVGLISVVLDVHSSIAAVAVQSCVFAILMIVGVVIQVCVKKYRSCLIRQSEDRSDIIKFAFTCGNLAQLHLKNFLAKSRKSTDLLEIASRDIHISESGAHPVSSESVILAVK